MASKYYACQAAGLLCCGTWILAIYMKGDELPLLKYFIYANLAGIGLNVVDKALRYLNSKTRVPDVVFHLLTIFGGAPAMAWCMMPRLLAHKTERRPYHESYLISAAVSCLALYLVAFPFV
uniref:Uncharacterized protein n=1 Tax=Ciona savignyi TaxID=51511 RepID=H2ZMI3_CIOSA